MAYYNLNKHLHLSTVLPNIYTVYVVDMCFFFFSSSSSSMPDRFRRFFYITPFPLLCFYRLYLFRFRASTTYVRTVLPLYTHIDTQADSSGSCFSSPTLKVLSTHRLNLWEPWNHKSPLNRVSSCKLSQLGRPSYILQCSYSYIQYRKSFALVVDLTDWIRQPGLFHKLGIVEIR